MEDTQNLKITLRHSGIAWYVHQNTKTDGQGTQSQIKEKRIFEKNIKLQVQYILYHLTYHIIESLSTLHPQ